MNTLDINTNYSESYKNAVLTIVAEDGLYTTAYIEVDNDVNCYDLCNDKYPEGRPFSPSVRRQVMAELKTIVDKNIEELIKQISVSAVR